jgi:hypothetical protein
MDIPGLRRYSEMGRGCAQVGASHISFLLKETGTRGGKWIFLEYLLGAK